MCLVGIIIVAAGEDRFGISGSVLVALVFCVALKLFACCTQQLAIGVPLGKFVSVRQTVGVNTDLVRSMKVRVVGCVWGARVMPHPAVSGSRVLVCLSLVCGCANHSWC